MLASIIADGVSPEDELRLDLQLNDFIKSMDDNQYFTGELFCNFMNEPNAKDWEHYP